ncbi:hypothetical protein [Sivoneniella epilithica]
MGDFAGSFYRPRMRSPLGAIVFKPFKSRISAFQRVLKADFSSP